MIALLADWDGHMDGWGWDGWGWLMAVGMVAFWIVLVIGIIWVGRELASGSRARHAGAGAPATDSSEILRRRLAEGEISIEEFRRLRAELDGSGSG